MASTENRIDGLMYDMGVPRKTKHTFTPIPIDQHKWQMKPGEDPLHRMWGFMVTLTSGHYPHEERSPFAVIIDRDGKKHAVDIVKLAELMGYEVIYARRLWAEGVKKGLWRNGAHSADKRLYFSGVVRPVLKEEDPPDPNKGEEEANKERLYSLLPDAIQKQTKAWPKVEKYALAEAIDAIGTKAKAVEALAVAAARRWRIREEDTTFLERGLKVPRQTHKKPGESEEDAQARLALADPIVEAITKTVQSSPKIVDTAETPLYNDKKNGRTVSVSLLLQKPLRAPRVPGRASVNQSFEAGGSAAAPVSKGGSAAPVMGATAPPNPPQQHPTPPTSRESTARTSQHDLAELFQILGQVQDEHPRTIFGKKPRIDPRNKGDQTTMRLIQTALGSRTPQEFKQDLKRRLRHDGQPLPEKLGGFIHWASDLGREEEAGAVGG